MCKTYDYGDRFLTKRELAASLYAIAKDLDCPARSAVRKEADHILRRLGDVVPYSKSNPIEWWIVSFGYGSNSVYESRTLAENAASCNNGKITRAISAE